MGGIIYNGDISFATYIVCLLIGIALIDLFNYLVARTNFFRAFAVGCPITLIADGKFCVDTINNKRNKVDLGVVASLLRSMGHFSFSNLDFLQIEPGGQLTVVEKKDAAPRPAAILLMNGMIFTDLLESLQRSDDWLMAQLRQAGVDDVAQVFLVQWWNDKLTIVLCDGSTREQAAAA
ncbi:membrane protein [Bordetella trematum]|nr:membrane protein [Bordetella trematum]